MTGDEIRELLGEGFHTAFRKATDSPEADAIWKLINELDDDEWASVINFVAAPLIDALAEKGR